MATQEDHIKAILLTLIESKLAPIDSSDTNFTFITICHVIYNEVLLLIENKEIILPLNNKIHTLTDDKVTLLIDESTLDEGLNKQIFANKLLDILLHGLSKEQKIAHLFSIIDEQRYCCKCEMIDWDVIKQGVLSLVEDLS